MTINAKQANKREILIQGGIALEKRDFLPESWCNCTEEMKGDY